MKRDKDNYDNRYGVTEEIKTDNTMIKRYQWGKQKPSIEKTDNTMTKR